MPDIKEDDKGDNERFLDEGEYISFDASKEDAFDPDQPRDENGRWGEGGAPSSKEKWDRARAHLAAKKQANKVTQAKPVQADLNSTGRLPENAVVELGASTPPVKAGYEDLAYISDVYDTAVAKGFKGTLDEFKNKLPPGSTQRANIVAGLDPSKLAKSETHAKVGHTTVERHFVKRVLDSVDQDSDDRAEDSGTDIEPAQEIDSGTDRS